MIEYKIGEIVIGTIINIHQYGAMLIFNDGRKGFLHISEVANSFIRNLKHYLNIGRTYNVKIIGIEDNGFLKVSMKQITNEDREIFHQNWQTKCPVEEKEIDFDNLRTHLEKWKNESCLKENENVETELRPFKQED